jgi:16S rRNA G527 N7-methylase RsmG
MAYGWATGDPGRVADLGSGAGLPGLPLAIVLPEWSFLLVERSAKRCGLLNRALRVLDLRNVTVMETDFRRRHEVVDVVLARAVAAPEELDPVVERWLGPSGTAVLAVSTVTVAPSGWWTVDIPEDILDRHARLLMMRRQ